MTHQITGAEPFLHRTLASVGIPPLHIVRANNGQEYRFYELSGDLPETLHFRDFESSWTTSEQPARIRLVSSLQPAPLAAMHVRGTSRVRLRD
jgi:hypothetical protein